MSGPTIRVDFRVSGVPLVMCKNELGFGVAAEECAYAFGGWNLRLAFFFWRWVAGKSWFRETRLGRLRLPARHPGPHISSLWRRRRAGHYIQLDEPALVVQAIRDVLELARQR